MTTNPFPSLCQQAYISDWWIHDPSKDLVPGRLIRKTAIHVDQNPKELVVTGRSGTSHNEAIVEIRQFNHKTPPAMPSMPVAALPQYDGERYLVVRAKRRPALVLTALHASVPKAMTMGAPNWQFSRNILAAPYYSVATAGKRSGWPAAFVDRVQRCEYPQYAWDRLPLPDADAAGSILRLDHLQSVPADSGAHEVTDWRLSDEAVEFMHDWVRWLKTGRLTGECMLGVVREELMNV